MGRRIVTAAAALVACAVGFVPRAAKSDFERSEHPFKSEFKSERHLTVSSAGWRHMLERARLSHATGRVRIEAAGAAAPLTYAQFKDGLAYLNSHSALSASGALAGHPALALIAQFANAQTAVAGESPATTQYLNYLTYRRSLGPTRFDHYHPVIGPLVGAQQNLQAGNCIPFNGLLPTSPYYNYLRFRRGIDPARFDHYHPRLGALLAEDARVRTLLAACAAGGGPPAGEGGGSGGNPGGGGGGSVAPPPAPEPASVVLFLIAAALLFGPRLSRRIVRRGRLVAASV